MWERTDPRPADVDTGQLYDGFSVLTIAGARGPRLLRAAARADPFVEGGANIARDGLLPLNTAGGQLSGGRLHGFSLIHEACVQLRGGGWGTPGRATLRGRNSRRWRCVANGGGPIAGTMLLTRGVS